MASLNNCTNYLIYKQDLEWIYVDLTNTNIIITPVSVLVSFYTDNLSNIVSFILRLLILL